MTREEAQRPEDSLQDSENVTKYQTAAEIVNRSLVELVAKCVAGASVVELCSFGDEQLLAGTAAVYNKSKNGKKIAKGIAFPTSINVNHQICHFSPLASDEEAAKVTLMDGDVVKIEMGAHVDGFPAMVGHTLVVGASASNPVTGKKADVIQAAYTAAEAALRLLRPEKTNFDVTDTVQKIVVDEFGCSPIEGILSSELRREVLDGQKQIIFNPSPSQRKDFDVTHFALGEVYSIDILVSSSADGKAKRAETRTTIYKRIPDATYQLKMQTSRKTLNEVASKFGYMPFNVRHLEDSKARVGLNECLKNQLIMPYEVLEENKGEIVAQFLFTALLMPSGNILKITQTPFDQAAVKSEKSVQDPELKKLLASGTKAPKVKKPVSAAATGAAKPVAV